jgi:hypothetical protein
MINSKSLPLSSLLLGGLFAASSASASGLPATVGASAGQPVRALSDVQRAELNARVELAKTIAQNVEADAQAKTSPDMWRTTLLTNLYSIRSEDLRNIAAQASTLKGAHQMARAAQQKLRAAAAAPVLGDRGDELVFTPVSTCRFLDTRNDPADGPLQANVPVDFDLGYTGTHYGATSTPCDLTSVQANITALAINATVVVPSAGPAGFLTIRDSDSTEITSFINWPSTGTTGLANAGVIGTSQVSGGNMGFEVWTPIAAKPNLIVDIFGYFSPAIISQPAAALDCAITAIANPSIPGNAVTTVTTPTCPSGYSVVMPSCYSPSNLTLTGTGYAGGTTNQATCTWNNTDSLPTTVFVYGVCCRTASR